MGCVRVRGRIFAHHAGLLGEAQEVGASDRDHLTPLVTGSVEVLLVLVIEVVIIEAVPTCLCRLRRRRFFNVGLLLLRSRRPRKWVLLHWLRRR